MNQPPELPPQNTAASSPHLNPASAGPIAFPPVPLRTLDEYDLGMPPRRRVLPIILFLATCFFTYAAGEYQWEPTFFGMDSSAWNPHYALEQLKTNWRDGLIYMGCVMAVLLAHEMGHFLMTVRYRVPASYPIFLPFPLMIIGTIGTVIAMDRSQANRKQLFDIGLAGPLAGLVLTIPMVWIGIKIATAETVLNGHTPLFGEPLFAKFLINWLRPDLAVNEYLKPNAIYRAGWVGMFVTGLNMMPVSQLDGGHVIYSLFLRRSRVIARAFLLSAIAFVVLANQIGWTLMIVIITFIGVDHPPTADDHIPLGRPRAILGTLSLAIPLLCFTPYPLYIG